MNKKSDFFANIVDFKGLKIKLSSPEETLSWSYGEVQKPETINYRTLKPEKDGLFCEKIFGPTKDWECYCGKYKRIRYKGVICDKCGVEVTLSKVRRERMGHITLASPICHVWYFKGAPSKLSLLLDVSSKDLESVIYFSQYLVLEVNLEKKKDAFKTLSLTLKKKLEEIKKEYKNKEREEEEKRKKEVKELKKKIKDKEARDLALSELSLKYKKGKANLFSELAAKESQTKEIFKTLTDLVKGIKKLSVITEEEYLKLQDYNLDFFFKVGMGGEAILSSLAEINLDKLAALLRQDVTKTTGQKYIKTIKRLRLVEGLKKSDLRPEWMVLTVLPVIPPDLRPMVQLTGGRFATSDLNDLYRRVINRNNRLKHLITLGAPEIILRNEKRMLQEAVDSLIDAAQRPTPRTSLLVKKLRSLSDMLRGKQGRFRQNLLGKRVDYSGRSVIVVGPELKLNYCGLPREMALEMFKPFVLRELIIRGLAQNVKNAKAILEKKPPEVWDILEEITKNHPVLLNRAPTLHRLGIQAFYPILVEGDAIRIHPCVCAGYNADFDGDQMAVHIPLSSRAKEEAVNLMMANKNLLKPADGSPITVPNKEMVLGCYYVTSIDQREEKTKRQKTENGRFFSDTHEAILAYQENKISLRELIKVRIGGKIIESSVGRILFNEVLPEKLRFINETIRASTIKNLIIKALDVCENKDVVSLIDGLKDLGFWGATISGGISVSVFDCQILPNKNNYIAEADERVSEIEKNYRQGLITKEEARRLSNDVWIEVTDKIADLTWENLDRENSVKMIIDSGGARASKDQLKQLCAMRGLAVDPLGKIVPLPTKSNFREGLSIFEYVTATRGSRKGLTDSALKTADAGYLTRRLVDVAHDVIVREEDCQTKEGIDIEDDSKRIKSFYTRILGRILAKKIIDPRTKKIILKEGEEINEKNIDLLKKIGIKKVTVRSPLTCKTLHGVCVLCYGRDLGTGKKVEVGTPVGVIAAQSIGEPGTQLTMRVRHTGGIVGLDVTQGLPRVEELFEVRTPKLLSPIAEISGVASIKESPEGYKVTIRTKTKPIEEREYFVPATSELAISDGSLVAAGMQLATGYLDIRKVLEVKGLSGAQKYLISEIQKVYESQGIPIDDKHFEVIIRKMSEKVRVETSGDTALLPGEFINKDDFTKENARVIAEGGEPATAVVTILGITKAALFTDSWLSAASFEQTTNVLADASVAGKEDYLLGLKENVIIGRLIPTSPDRVKIE